MRYDVKDVSWEVIELLDELCLFVDERINRASVPKGLYLYEVRHADDDWGEPVEIAEGILVNFFGTILSKKELPLEEFPEWGTAYLDLDEEDWGWLGQYCTPEEFLSVV